MASDPRYRCPVCGWDGLDEPAWVGASQSDEICPCCGTHLGLDDGAGGPADRSTRHAELRARWVEGGAVWWSSTPAPPGWDAGAQLADLGAGGPDGLVRAAEMRVDATDVDLVSGLLWGAGVSAVGEEAQADGSVVLRTDVPAGGVGALRAALGDRWPLELVAVDDGADAWRAHARVVRAGRVVVRPPWVPLGPVAPGEVVVEVDPGPTFGHGAHPTTRLCLAALDRLLSLAPPPCDSQPGSSSSGVAGCGAGPIAPQPCDSQPGSSSSGVAGTGGGPSVLDVGCGSGVLAVAAVLLGAGRAVGVDVDPAALVATRANAGRNGVADRVAVRLADDLPEETFAVVVANIGAAVLRELAPMLVARVAPGGALVVSGLLDPPPPDLAAALAPLEVAADERTDGWTALTLR